MLPQTPSMALGSPLSLRVGSDSAPPNGNGKDAGFQDCASVENAGLGDGSLATKIPHYVPKDILLSIITLVPHVTWTMHNEFSRRFGINPQLYTFKEWDASATLILTSPQWWGGSSASTTAS